MSQAVICFWCEQLPLVTVSGVSLCADHARCAACGRFVLSQALTCRCERYGSYGHTELVYCSEGCRDALHPQPEWEHPTAADVAQEVQG